MKKSSAYPSEPPAPRARPPLRRHNPEENDSRVLNDSKELLRENMYDPRRQQEYFNDFNNYDVQYTDSDTDTDSEVEDDEYDDDDEEDRDIDIDDVDDGSFNHGLNTSHSLLSESYKTAQSSPIDTLVQRKNIENVSRYKNDSRPFNVTRSPNTHKIRNQSAKNSTKHSNILWYIVICIVLIILISILFNKNKVPKNEVDKKVTLDKNKMKEINKRLVKSIDVIRSRFQNQKANIWNDISAGIYDVVLFPTRPSIIVLFGNKTETLNCLAQLLAEVSGDILGSNDHLTLVSDDFPNDVGQVIDILKERIVQKKAIVVQDLFSINTAALKAFHNFCDREKPLVGHAIYIITIVVDEYKASYGQLRFVEQQIYKRLKGQIDKDNISPLITRLTDGVVAPILSEPNTKFDDSYCSLSINNKL